MRGYWKKVSEVKEYYAVALATAAPINSQPMYFELLYKVALPSRDGVLWLLRHDKATPPRQGKVKIQEGLVDRYRPGRLFHMEELRSLTRKYIQVVRHYYVQYLAGYGKSPLFEQQRNLAAPLNTVSFHTRMVDDLRNMAGEQDPVQSVVNVFSSTTGRGDIGSRIMTAALDSRLGG